MNNKQKTIFNDLQEMMNENPGDNTQQCMQGVLGTMQSIGELRFAIEFECGDCCKTISGELDETEFVFLNGVLLLFGELQLKECCDKSVRTKKEILLIIIPLDKISSFEVFERSCYCPVTEA